MEKNRKPILGVGTSSILLIFILLCLVTFAVLSLVSARSDYRLSKKNADHVTAYYEAENQASEILSRIEDCLAEQYKLLGNTPEYYEHIQSELDGTDSITFLSQREISYQVPAGESQELSVTLLLPETVLEGEPYFEITSWRLIHTGTWQPEENLPVYGSEET